MATPEAILAAAISRIAEQAGDNELQKQGGLTALGNFVQAARDHTHDCTDPSRCAQRSKVSETPAGLLAKGFTSDEVFDLFDAAVASVPAADNPIHQAN